jgi:hypothetical protein
MRLERAERFVICFLLLMAVLAICIAELKHINVAYSEYRFRSTLAAVFFVIGQFYRSARNHPSLATSATAIALFLAAGQTMRLFNYVLLPYEFGPIDGWLASIDANFGFVWSSFASDMAGHPMLSDLLRTVYISSYIQIISLIFLLGIFGKTCAVTRFLTANISGGLVTITIWFLFPSSTPAAFQTLSPDIASKLNLVLTAEYGRWLANAGQNGLHTLNPSALGGIVGFPSFHTVMSILVVRYSKEIPYGLAVYATLNILMIPAILLHGAHNLVDIVGGFAVAAIAIWLAEKNAGILSGRTKRGEALVQ